MAARCDRSASAAITETPKRAAMRSAASFGAGRSCRTMLAPAAARLSATASPRPAVAPVTRAHFPFIRYLFPVELGEHFLGVAERIDAGRHAAIDRHLHEHLADFL